MKIEITHNDKERAINYNVLFVKDRQKDNEFYRGIRRIYNNRGIEENKISKWSQKIISGFLLNNKKIKIIERIAGGLDRDNDMGAFCDYYSTLEYMKDILIENENSSPFTIISDKFTKEQCGCGVHFSPIAKEVILHEDGTYFVLKDNIYVSEFDYIMSRDWIKEWKVDDKMCGKDKWKYRLMLYDDKTELGVITGVLTIT